MIDDREDHHLAERPQHVDRRQEQVEVVVVGALRLPEVAGRDQPGGDVRRQQPEDVERDDGDEAGDHPGGDEERQGRDAHDLEGVDLLADPHRAELGGEAAADRGRERQAGDERGDLAGVEVGGDEAGEGRGAELVERGVALQADLGAGEEGEEGDDADGAADDRERAGAEADLGEEPEDLLLVAADGAPAPARWSGRRSASARRGRRAVVDASRRACCERATGPVIERLIPASAGRPGSTRR